VGSEPILSDGKKNPEQLQYRYLADGECRRPLRAEDVQADGAVRVDVRMINASSERILSDGKKNPEQRQYRQWWAKLLRSLTVNSLSYFVKKIY
jgi:hypothetical protein